jgi:hypothetical protein
VFAVNPVLECEKASTVVPLAAKELPVGAGAVPHTVPRAVTLAPPSEVMVAPKVADVVAIEAEVGVESTGAVITIPDKVKSSIRQFAVFAPGDPAPL